MDIIFEFLFDLFVEGSFELANNKKLSLWIRIPFMIIMSLFILGIIGLIGFIGVYCLVKPDDTFSIIVGIILLLADIAIIIGIINKFKKIKQERKR